MEKKTAKQQTGIVRTIITNAVYGRSTQMFNPTVYISSNDNRNPTQVLGCAITGAHIRECGIEEVFEDMVNVRVEGTFEVHVWYELSGDTHVTKNTIRLSEIIPVKCLGGEFQDNKQVISWINKNPTSLGTMIINKAGTPTISVQVEYELGVEVVGEAKINILSYQPDKVEKVKKDEIFTSSQPSYDFDVDNEDDD